MDYQKDEEQIKRIPRFSPGLSFRPRKTNLNDIVRGLEGLLPGHLGDGIEARVTLADQALSVMTDISLIGKVLMGFVKTARETINGSGTVAIKTGLAGFADETGGDGWGGTGGRCAVCSVTGFGSNMDEQKQKSMAKDMLFTKGRADSARSMLTAYAIIKQHNGSINIETSPGQGVTVHVYLPLLNEGPNGSGPIPLSRPAGTGTIRSQET